MECLGRALAPKRHVRQRLPSVAIAIAPLLPSDASAAPWVNASSRALVRPGGAGQDTIGSIPDGCP